MRSKAMRQGYRLRGRRLGLISTGVFEPRPRPSSRVGMPLLQPPPQLRPQPANVDNGKRHKLDKEITEEELRKRSSEGEVEDEVSSLEEVKVQKKLVKEVKIEVMENPRFMSEARRKELERGKEKRSREESTSMPVLIEEKRKLSFSPYPHHRRGELEAHAASAIQQPVVENEQERKPEVMGASSVLPLLPKLPVLFRNKAVLLSKACSSVA
jgi:hypothetical protein